MDRERITLTLVTPHNADAYRAVRHEIMQDPERFGQFGAWTDFATDVKDDWHHLHFLAVRAADPSAPIGFGVLTRQHMNESASMQLGLLRAWRGKGYGAIVGRLLLRYGFESLGLHRMESTALGSNPASVKMQKGGMRIEGIERQAVRVRGEFVDRTTFALLRDEWLAQTNGTGRPAPAAWR